jgi:hypothetical protein
VKFYKTNTKDDPGFDKTPKEVADEFWASERGQKWASGEWEGLLARFSINFLESSYGGWDPAARDDLDEVLEAIYQAMPRRRVTR